MNKRNVSLVGLAAGVTLLAGCVAQYQNPGACEQEMRTRLNQASLGELSVTHTAVAYRGERVVIEGHLERGVLPASEAVAASAAVAASGAHAATGASSAAVASAASAASGASSTHAAEAKPSTPVELIARKLGLHKTPPTATAAECTYDHTGSLTSFHWLAPAALVKTTPASDASAQD
ncbi:hypothetical protein [Paraburkholderia tropica]|uniref:Lipoprotein n=1 Tax=Paraburkholderia tropica TaxID=92647 RepID=A0AAQ1JV33_9BURK|nr:hypothetical protein [Paraburkholderia tropica]RQN38565.1 hypothetical protein EHZ25_12450 [Paraburkholderia tropica]SEJ88625.1 hypothetical protein SAMN05216550_11020 [Paraburkholderia tropica]